MKISKGVATAVSVALCLAASAAHAEIPNYDPDKYCTRIASVGGSPSQSTKRFCLQQEQSAYDALKPKWESLPSAARLYCDRIARVGGEGSYHTLGFCITQETAAGKSNDQFQFKR
jgi:hypothetical protein